MAKHTKRAHPSRRKSNVARSMWSGSISFGLVNIPVRLYPAVRQNEVHFHLLHDQDKSRLQRKMVCPVDAKEVPGEHIIKGYEVSPGRHVIVEDSELKALAPKASRAIEVLYFVDLKNIDPLYFQHPYYLLPDEGAEKSYMLFVEAMSRSKKIAIARFVMRNKEYVACVRAMDNVLLLETMYFADEIIPSEKLDWTPSKAKVGERELKTAEQLIDSLSADFEPEKLHDEYQEAVRDMVEKKAEGEEVVVQPEAAPEKTEVSDILAALEASLAKAKKHREKPSGRSIFSSPAISGSK
jgi:DNA end-binding protein Ku